jgi:hypothetical protein
MLVSCLAYSLTLKMEVICSSGMLVDTQWTTQRYIPKNRTLVFPLSWNLYFVWWIWVADSGAYDGYCLLGCDTVFSGRCLPDCMVHIPEESNFHLIGFEFIVVCLVMCYTQFLIICIINGCKRRHYSPTDKIVSPAIMNECKNFSLLKGNS